MNNGTPRSKVDDDAVFFVFEAPTGLAKAVSFKEKQITIIFKRAEKNALGQYTLAFTLKHSEDHDDHYPVVDAVTPSSEAYNLGVKPGFELVQVDDQGVMNWELDEVNGLLQRWIDKVGAKAGILGARDDDQLYLVFENKKAALKAQKSYKVNQKTVAFTKRPLGFLYKPVTPIRVSEVEPGSEANEAGVTVGMTIVQIDGEVVLNMDFDQVDKLIKKATKKLDKDERSKDEKMWEQLKETAAVKDKHDMIVKTVSARLDHLETRKADETKTELALMSAKNAELERRLAELEARYQAEPAPSYWWSWCTSRPSHPK